METLFRIGSTNSVMSAVANNNDDIPVLDRSDDSGIEQSSSSNEVKSLTHTKPSHEIS